jgi:hypothetical protein
MKRNILTLAEVLLVVLIFGQTRFLAWADDFSFIGIKWNDNRNTVVEKILKSDYVSSVSAQYLRKPASETLCGTLSNVMLSPMVDKKKYDYLSKVSLDDVVRSVDFLGKDDTIVEKARFWFPCKGDKLLAYNIYLNHSTVKVDEDTGDSQVYRSLVKKYGNPTKTDRFSKVWSKQDQTLYYWAVAGNACLIYVGERNLSNYIASIQGKQKQLRAAGDEKQSDSVKKDF